MIKGIHPEESGVNMLNDKEYIGKLNFIRDYVINLWKNNRGLPPHFTIHDASHSQCVADAIYKLIPTNRRSQLIEEEKFYLLSSAWLHDIGMIPDLLGTQDNYEKVRQEHHIRSKKYIEKEHEKLGLEVGEAKIIGEICKYHRKTEDIMKCQTKFGNVRLQLLASYLRLADAIHIDKTRVEESLFRIFLATGMTWESKYHWLKSFWIQYVIPNFDDLTINISLLISQDDAENVHIIRDMIEDEVRAELYTVKDILIRGGISYFLDVKTEFGPGVPDEYRIDIEQIIGNIQLERKPSASDIITTIIDTILHILDLPDKRQAYSVIKTYQSEVIQNIVKNRPCHILVKKVNNFIEDGIKEDEQNLSDSQVDSKILNIKNKIHGFKESRRESLDTLLRWTRAVLGDYTSILLFGYSNLVIKALESAASEIKEKTKIYICECRGKDQYNDMNELIYCDGIEYASQLKKIGYKEIYLVPDILVGNLIARGLISKVIFGANGVDIKTGKFGHTAGHLTIADIAHLYKIPVYVILDSHKFGAMDHDPELEREINWVTGDKKALLKLEGIKLFNPREDTVDADKVYALVTDYGIFPPSRIPDVVRGGHGISGKES